MAWPFQKKDVSAQILEALDNGDGVPGTVRLSTTQAFGVVAVFAAIRVISEDVAKLPARLKRTTGGKTEIAFDEPEHTILSSVGKPATDEDDGFTAMEWIESTIASAALEGIGVCYLNRVGGITREITPIKRGCWRNEDGKWSIKWRDRAWERVSRSNLLVVRGPQLGLNVTQQARQAIDLAIKLDGMMASLARKGGRPNGIISAEGLSGISAAKEFLARIKKYFGSGGDGGLMPLDVGKLHYTKLSFSPEELQADATYARVVRQIASALRVQPARIMHEITDHNNASAYQWNIAHVSDTIQPWTKRLKQSFNKDVLRERVQEGLSCDIELKGLLSGSPKERGEFLLKLRTMAALSPKAVAELEDLPTEGLSANASHPLLTNPNPQQKDGNSGQN